MNPTALKAINTLRFLSVDMIQKAKSGHPGLPLGAAPTAYTVWHDVLKHNPQNPNWLDRDRFVLSAGHGSALLYSLLHVFGYGLTRNDLKSFRQWGALTPGHPEYRHTKGVEITTGPLGQGIANAVGFAWAESYLAAHFNKPDFEVVDHFTYALCGDGCLMEGVALEAISLAGTLGLSKLIVLYDSNNITIEGGTDIAFRENVGMRFSACGWQVLRVEDGNDIEAIAEALKEAQAETKRPSLIEIKTQIGYGSPNKQGKNSAHGEPLGESEIALTKEALNWPHEEDFFVPDEVSADIAQWQQKATAAENKWNKLMEAYAQQYPADYRAWQAWHSDTLSDEWETLIASEAFWHYEGVLATRVSSEQVLNKVCQAVPNLIGGSADLAPSTKTIMKGRGDYSAENPSGANLHFGIREHAMTAIANGMAAHGGLRPYVAGFFVFSDYMKPAMRLSAMMGLPVIYIMTHDSIGVGEDGPTHEPIEHLPMLRSIPNFTVIRPCDSRETAAAWVSAITHTDGPTALVLSRQNLPLLPGSGLGLMKGAYILIDAENPNNTLPDIILLASGSEVSLIYEARALLKEHGIHARVVSVPSFELFAAQNSEYQKTVLPDEVRARLAVEAASPFGWHQFTGLDGDVLAMEHYGASAPAEILFKKFGFIAEKVAERALQLVGRKEKTK